MHRLGAKICAAFAATVLLASAASAQQLSPIPVTVVQAAETLPTLPFLYAKDAGLFEKAGLTVTWLPLTPNSTQVAAILDTGQADFGQAGASASFNAQAVGKDIVAFAMLSQGAFLQLVLTQDALKRVGGVTPSSPVADKIKALKGLKIALSTPGNTPDLILRTLLRGVGLDPDRDVTLLPNSNFSALMPTARAGRADGFLLNPPFTTMAEVEGWGKVWIDFAGGEVEAINETPQLVMLAKRATLTSKPEAAKRMVKAVRLAMVDIKQRPDAVRDLIRSKHFEDIDAKVFDVAFRAALKSFDHNLVVTQRGYEELVANMVVTGVSGEPVKVPYDKAFDFSVVRATK